MGRARRRISRSANSTSRIAVRLLCAGMASLGMASGGRANSLDSAAELCAIMNATGLLKAPCAVSSFSGTIGLLMNVSAEQAEKTCGGVRDLAAENGLAFDLHWSVAIMTPENNQVPLAVCKLEKPAPTVESFGLRRGTE